MTSQGLGNWDSQPFRLPETVVAEMASRSVRFETPCGEGRTIWRCWGNGPPILLLHGAFGSWLHWIRNIAHLSKTRTVWVPDIPGFGHSAVPCPDPSITDIVGAIMAGLNSLDVYGPLDVLGFSFGGTVAAHLAIAGPGRVRKIILIDCGGLGTPLAKIDLKRVQRDVNDLQAHRHNLLALMIHEAAKVDPLALHVQARQVPLGRVDVRDMVLPDRLLRALQQSNVPVDAIWGEYDRPHPDPDQQLAALRQVRPDARMRVVPDAGHWCNYENASVFEAHLDELL